MRIRNSGPRAAAGRVAVTALLAAATAGPLAAQVGKPPGQSPFHDLTVRQSFTFSAGRFGGNAAVAGVGWRAGPLAAVRLDTRLAGPVMNTDWLSPAQLITSCPPGSSTVTRASNRPCSCPATTAAQAPVPQAWVSPAPRS